MQRPHLSQKEPCGVSRLKPGTVFMDNLTVGMALDLLRVRRHREEIRRDDVPLEVDDVEAFLEKHPEPSRFSGYKTAWFSRYRYTWADAALELASLSSLVESLVIHDAIYVDEAFSGYWMTDGISKSSWLEQVIIPVSVTGSDREILVRRAVARVLGDVSAHVRNRERIMLDHHWVTWAMISLSVVSYPDKTLSHWGQRAAGELELDLSKGRMTLFGVDCSDLLKVLKEKPPYWGEEYEFIGAPARREVVTDRKPRVSAIGGDAVEVLLLQLGALFYDEMARAFERPYVPHIARAWFLRCDHALRNGPPTSAAKRAVEYVERAREPLVETVHKFIGENIFDIRLPAILAVVLRQGERREDLLTVAQQLRNSKEARAFREWAAQLDDAIADGDIAQIESSVNQLQEVADRLAKRIQEEPRTVAVQIGISPLLLEIGVPIPRAMTRIAGQKKHFAFLHEMHNRMLTIGRLEKEICRVFGRDTKICQAAHNLRRA